MEEKKNDNEVKDVKKNVGKKKTKAMNLYLFFFLLVYSYLQLGFSGLYTYTTISVLYTCLMYFSVFALYTGICMFIKFRKKEYTKKEVDTILRKTFIGIVVLIVLYSFVFIGNYINNLNGILRAKENYGSHTEKIKNIYTENIVENTVSEDGETNNAGLIIMQDMLAYDSAMKDLDSLYNGMKENMGSYIGLRVLTDIVDIGISAVVILVLSRMMIYKISNIKEEN